MAHQRTSVRYERKNIAHLENVFNLLSWRLEIPIENFEQPTKPYMLSCPPSRPSHFTYVPLPHPVIHRPRTHQTLERQRGSNPLPLSKPPPPRPFSLAAAAAARARCAAPWRRLRSRAPLLLHLRHARGNPRASRYPPRPRSIGRRAAELPPTAPATPRSRRRPDGSWGSGVLVATIMAWGVTATSSRSSARSSATSSSSSCRRSDPSP